MPSLGVSNIRAYLFLAFITNILTIIGLIIANVVDPIYFNTWSRTIQYLPYDIILLNIFTRFVLPPFYFVITLWIVFYFIVSLNNWKRFRVSSKKAQYFSWLFAILQAVALAIHTIVICFAIDMYRTNPECGTTAGVNLRQISQGWTWCQSGAPGGAVLSHFPWHLVVLGTCGTSLLCLISLIFVIKRFLWFHKKVRIFTLLDNTPRPYENPNYPDKTRVIKIEASGPMDKDGNIRVLLKEREDGELLG